jgi:hypothetical protein
MFHGFSVAIETLDMEYGLIFFREGDGKILTSQRSGAPGALARFWDP